jgi:3D (Asp-Asp-Asp) domain-containing protein
MVVAAAVLDAVAGCGLFRSAPPAPPPVVTPAPRLLDFEATAYSITGTTASGMQTRRGIVAADPKVLPIGSRIRVQDAGRYSGIYTVADTGSAINGHEIDIFIPSLAEAKRFGRRKVRVQILDKK